MADIIRYTFTGADGERIPHDATHIFVDAKFIPSRAFQYHYGIIEVICHDRVEKIEEYAFRCCSSMKRLFMPGVKVVGSRAFSGCPALKVVECDKLEKVGKRAFIRCTSLRSINLPSAEVVEVCAFAGCDALSDAQFGNRLERIEELVFCNCKSLERITIPLKDGMIMSDDIFSGCVKMKQVDLVEGVQLHHETIAVLQLEEWRNDMNEEIDTINQILPNTDAGGWDSNRFDWDGGEEVLVIRRWIRAVLRKTFSTRQSINAYWMRLQLHSSGLLCLGIL